MRLNRNSAIFIAVLAVVIIVAGIFLNGDNDNPVQTENIEATAEIIQLFPGVLPSNVVSLTITEQREVGDIRPTPIPGNPTLVPPTDLPDGVDTPTTNEVVLLSKDDLGVWQMGEGSNQTLTSAIDAVALETALSSLVSIRSNRQFIPENGDYAQFGLDDPSFDIAFTEQATNQTGVSGDSQPTPVLTPNTYRLRIGNRTVSDNSYYAFLNDDTQTVYVINNASALQTGILNITTRVPVQPTAAPTLAPILNTTAPLAGFVLANASSFNFANNATGKVISITRNELDGTWVYLENGLSIPVQQESLQIILNSLSIVRGVDQSEITDLAALGLDAPTYRFEATTLDGQTYLLQLGDQDPTGTIYYALVDTFTSVVLIDADSVALLIDMFDNPPLPVQIPLPETTAEATVDPEMTEAASEATAEPEMTEMAMEATAEVEMTEMAMEVTEDADCVLPAEMTPEATMEMTAEVEMTAEAEMTPEMTPDPCEPATDSSE